MKGHARPGSGPAAGTDPFRGRPERAGRRRYPERTVESVRAEAAQIKEKAYR